MSRQSSANRAGQIVLEEATKARRALMTIETTKVKIKVNNMSFDDVIKALKAEGIYDYR